MLDYIIVGNKQEAACAARRVANTLAWRGAHYVHDCLDEGAWGEILARTGLCVLGVFLQEALVYLAFDVNIEAGPRLTVDEVNQAAQLGRVLDFVLGLAEDDRD